MGCMDSFFSVLQRCIYSSFMIYKQKFLLFSTHFYFSKVNLSHLCFTSCLLAYHSGILFLNISFSLLFNSNFYRFLVLPNFHIYTQTRKTKFFFVILSKNELFIRIYSGNWKKYTHMTF